MKDLIAVTIVNNKQRIRLNNLAMGTSACCLETNNVLGAQVHGDCNYFNDLCTPIKGITEI